MLSENGSFLNKFLRNKSSVYFRNDLLQFFTLCYFLNESYFREATCGFCISKFWLFHCRYRSGGGMCKFVHFGSHWLHKNMCGQSLKDLIVIKIIYFLFHGIPWGYGHLIRLNHHLLIVSQQQFMLWCTLGSLQTWDFILRSSTKLL